MTQLQDYARHNANVQASPDGQLARYLAAFRQQELERPDAIRALLDTLWERHADSHGLDEEEDWS